MRRPKKMPTHTIWWASRRPWLPSSKLISLLTISAPYSTSICRVEPGPAPSSSTKTSLSSWTARTRRHAMLSLHLKVAASITSSPPKTLSKRWIRKWTQTFLDEWACLDMAIILNLSLCLSSIFLSSFFFFLPKFSSLISNLISTIYELFYDYNINAIIN